MIEEVRSHGAAVERARLLVLAGHAYVAIFDADPRVHADAKPIATRIG